MANPQIEDGYTRIANELLEAISLSKLNGSEHQVFWVIVRKTYGYQKKDDPISLSQFCLATRINKQNVCRALSNLITKNMIIKSDKDKITKYRIQKDYTTWKPLSNMITLSNPIKPVINSDKEIVINSETHKRKKNTKETLTKEKKSIVPSMQGQSSGPQKPTFDFGSQSWKNITEDNLKIWRAAYPACDIQVELAKMAAWLLGNPESRKTRYDRFIPNWLARSQDKGGTKAAPSIDEKVTLIKKQEEK